MSVYDAIGIAVLRIISEPLFAIMAGLTALTVVARKLYGPGTSRPLVEVAIEACAWAQLAMAAIALEVVGSDFMLLARGLFRTSILTVMVVRLLETDTRQALASLWRATDPPRRCALWMRKLRWWRRPF